MTDRAGLAAICRAEAWRLREEGIGMKHALIVALMVALGGAPAVTAEPQWTPPEQSGVAPDIVPGADAPAVDSMPSFGDKDPELTGSSPQGQTFVAEILDSLFVVGPAEFFALDLPLDPAGARAVHLLGTISVTDRKGDIQVRLFRSPDYQSWLKKRGGEKAGAFWVSKRSRSITLDHDLAPGGPFVLLLDNGYSMRTSKHIRAQMQIQYEWIGSRPLASAGRDSSAVGSIEDDIIKPRANTEEDVPPPPPPPPDDGAH